MTNFGLLGKFCIELVERKKPAGLIFEVRVNRVRSKSIAKIKLRDEGFHVAVKALNLIETGKGFKVGELFYYFDHAHGNSISPGSFVLHTKADPRLAELVLPHIEGRVREAANNYLRGNFIGYVMEEKPRWPRMKTAEQLSQLKRSQLRMRRRL